MTEVQTVEADGVGDGVLGKLLEVVVTEVQTGEVTAVADHLPGGAPQELPTESICQTKIFSLFYRPQVQLLQVEVPHSGLLDDF